MLMRSLLPVYSELDEYTFYEIVLHGSNDVLPYILKIPSMEDPHSQVSVLAGFFTDILIGLTSAGGCCPVNQGGMLDYSICLWFVMDKDGEERKHKLITPSQSALESIQPSLISGNLFDLDGKRVSQGSSRL